MKKDGRKKRHSRNKAGEKEAWEQIGSWIELMANTEGSAYQMPDTQLPELCIWSSQQPYKVECFYYCYLAARKTEALGVSVTWLRVCLLSCFSRVWLFVTLWTDSSLPGSSVHEILQTNTGMTCYALLQGNLPNLGIEPESHLSCTGRRVLYR